MHETLLRTMPWAAVCLLLACGAGGHGAPCEPDANAKYVLSNSVSVTNWGGRDIGDPNLIKSTACQGGFVAGAVFATQRTDPSPRKSLMSLAGLNCLQLLPQGLGASWSATTSLGNGNGNGFSGTAVNSACPVGSITVGLAFALNPDQSFRGTAALCARLEDWARVGTAAATTMAEAIGDADMTGQIVCGQGTALVGLEGARYDEEITALRGTCAALVVTN